MIGDRARTLFALMHVPWSAPSGAFLRNSFSVILGNGLGAIVGVVALRIYTELAPAHVFGTANLVLGALALGSQIFIQPISATQLRYHTEAMQNGLADLFTAQALAWGCAAAAVFAIVTIAVLGIASASGLTGIGLQMLLGAICWICVSAPRQILAGRLHAEQRMTIYMSLRVLEALAIAVITAFMLMTLIRPEAFLWGQALAYLVVIGATVLLAPSPVLRFVDMQSMSAFLPKLWRYGAPFVPMALLYWLSNLADRYVLAGLVSTTAVGQYLAAFAIAAAGFGLTNGAMGDLFRPKLFDAENRGDRAGAHRVFLAWLGGYGVVALGGLGFILLCGHWIVGLVLAAPYRPGATSVMLWIAVGYAISGVTIALENRVFSLGHSARVIGPLIVGALANIVFSLLLIPRFGAVGAAQASCAGFALKSLVTGVVLWRALGRRP